MKRYLFILFTFLLTTISYGQNDYLQYYKTLNTAHALVEVDKLDSAFTLYQHAFRLVDFIHEDEIDDFVKLCKKLKNRPISKKYQTLKDKQCSSVNKVYKAIIDSLGKEDQRVRRNKYYRAKDYFYKVKLDSTFSPKVKKYKKAHSLMQDWWNTDSSNVAMLNELINKYGFPGERLVGKRSYEVAIITLLHYDRDTANQIIGEVLKQALYSGDIKPSDYAWIIDRHLMYAGKKQKYLSIPIGIDQLSKAQIREINKERQSIGLKPMRSIKIIKKKNGVVIKNN